MHVGRDRHDNLICTPYSVLGTKQPDLVHHCDAIATLGEDKFPRTAPSTRPRSTLDVLQGFDKDIVYPKPKHKICVPEVLYSVFNKVLHLYTHPKTIGGRPAEGGVGDVHTAISIYLC